MKRYMQSCLLCFFCCSFQLFPMYSTGLATARAASALVSGYGVVVPSSSMVSQGMMDRGLDVHQPRRRHMTLAGPNVYLSAVSNAETRLDRLALEEGERVYHYGSRPTPLQQIRINLDRAIRQQAENEASSYASSSVPATEGQTFRFDDAFSKSAPLRLQDSRDDIISERYRPEATYEELDKDQKRMIKPERYADCVERYKNLKNVEVQKITYKVDGLDVDGFMLLPKAAPEDKLPLVVYNRGGHRKWGRIDLNMIMNDMMIFAENGYVVVASQYRGTKGADVPDEFGGVDVDDPIRLLEIALEFNNIDKDNIFTVGFSRGSIMNHRILQELKRRIPIRASASIGVVSDLDKLLHESSFALPLLQDAVKNFDENFTEECKKRSVVHWLDVYDEVPILFLHNEVDPIVPVSQAYLLNEKLNERGNAEHKMIIYPDRGHALNKFREEGNAEILKWLNTHKKNIIK